jgi:rhodanese-related sulfurtransferase
VLYSDHAQESQDALAQFRSAGFDNVSLVKGNFNGWKQRNNPITSGSVVTTATWIKKPGKGKITLAEFKRAQAGQIDAVLLDVRTTDEVAAGKLPGTIHIPLEDLAEREDELPADKKIYIHCSNGSRAELASWILRGNGYNTFTLQATLECNNGECELLD